MPHPGSYIEIPPLKSLLSTEYLSTVYLSSENTTSRFEGNSNAIITYK